MWFAGNKDPQTQSPVILNDRDQAVKKLQTIHPTTYCQEINMLSSHFTVVDLYKLQ